MFFNVIGSEFIFSNSTVHKKNKKKNVSKKGRRNWFIKIAILICPSILIIDRYPWQLTGDG